MYLWRGRKEKREGEKQGRKERGSKEKKKEGIVV